MRRAFFRTWLIPFAGFMDRYEDVMIFYAGDRVNPGGIEGNEKGSLVVRGSPSSILISAGYPYGFNLF
jgi:hypothetical protein